MKQGTKKVIVISVNLIFIGAFNPQNIVIKECNIYSEDAIFYDVVSPHIYIQNGDSANPKCIRGYIPVLTGAAATAMVEWARI